MDPTAKLISGFSFIAFAILIPPFVWHCKCCNIPAVALIFWLMFSDFTGFVDAIIWGGPDWYKGYDGVGYCDITIKLKASSGAGKLCATSAIALQLMMILKANNQVFMSNTNRKKILLDLAICFTTPIFIMATNYIVLNNRITILKYEGCTAFYAPTWVTLVLSSMWNIIWSFVAVVLAILTVITYFQKRRDVKDILKCTNSGLNLKRFARLLGFSLLVILTVLPLSIYNFVEDAEVFTNPLDWDTIHSPTWNSTLFILADISSLADKWIDLGLSLVAFLIFGLGADALSMYKTVLRRLGFGRFFKGSGIIELTSMSSNTRVDSAQTGKSGFSLLSDKNGAVTITDSVDMEFDKIMGDSSPSSADTKFSKYSVKTIDLEKGNDLSNYLGNEGINSQQELEYIMHMCEPEVEGDDFSFLVKYKI